MKRQKMARRHMAEGAEETLLTQINQPLEVVPVLYISYITLYRENTKKFNTVIERNLSSV
jgi:hypothetical protein